MTLRRSLVVFAAWIVDHADVGHAALGFGALVTLLTHARGIQADVSARLTARVALPRPRLLLAKRLSLAQQFGHALSGCFGDALDRRFAQPQSTQLLERDLGRLRETGLHAGDAGHLAGGRRQSGHSQPQRLIPRNVALPAMATVVVTTRQANRAQQTVTPLAALLDESRVVRPTLDFLSSPFFFFFLMIRRPPRSTLFPRPAHGPG